MCFVVLVGVVLPRVTLFLLWLLTEWTKIIEPWWLGILGFLFLPYTTLAYVCIHHYSGHVSVSEMPHLILIVFALIFDVTAWGGGHRHYRYRRVAIR